MKTILLAMLMLGAATELSPQEKLNELTAIRGYVERIDYLKDHKISVDVDNSIRNDLMMKAETISDGKVKSYEDLKELTGGDFETPTVFERVSGFFTFTRIITVLAAILITIACTLLFGHYALAILDMVPDDVWNIVAWGTCIGAISYGTQLSPDYMLYSVLPGTLGLMGCLYLTTFLYFGKSKNYYMFFGALSVLWAAVALFYGSHVVGFFTVMSFMASLGFISGMIPGVIWIGFDTDDIIPRATLSAGAILALHVLLTITGNTAQQFEPFREGMNFMGSFVFYLGMLIMSSKWMYKGNTYLLLQFLTCVAGCAAIWLGSVYHMSTLLGIGGTFFCLYILEKYYEIPWKKAGWIWSLLGLGIILYCFSIFAQSHSQYFIFM